MNKSLPVNKSKIQFGNPMMDGIKIKKQQYLFSSLLICIFTMLLGCEDRKSHRLNSINNTETENTSFTFFVGKYLISMPYSVPYGGEQQGGMRLYPEAKKYFVEYDGMGFEARLDTTNNTYKLRERADLAGEKLYAKENKDLNINWATFTVSSEEIHVNAQGLQNRFRNKFTPPATAKPFERYKKLPDTKWGLDRYLSDNPNRQDTKDWFVYRDKQTNLVRTIIGCSNRNVRKPPCSHDFNLSPIADIQVSIRYSRKFLPYWKEIEQLATKIFIDSHNNAVKFAMEKENVTN